MFRSSFAFLFLFAASAASADYISPADVKVQTAAYQPERINLLPGKYVYSVSWQGIPVARAEISVDQLGDDRIARVAAKARTATGIDLFYKLRHSSESLFHIDHFRPIRFDFSQTENSRKKEVHISFTEDGEIVSEHLKDRKLDQVRFHPNNLTLDPISAAFLARSIPLREGTKASFDVFNGKHRYLIHFLVEEKEMVSVDGKETAAWRVTPQVEKLTDTQGENRLKGAHLYVSADEQRNILRVDSKVLIGRVVAKLEEFIPSPAGQRTAMSPSGSKQPG